MITLKDLFNQLESSELNQMYLSGGISSTTKGISVKNYPELIDMFNLALTALHTRLNLKEREVVVQTYDALSFYKLDSRYSVSAGTPGPVPLYIIDTVENPFKDDIIRVERVYDESGAEISINDDNDEMSCYLSAHDTIQIPYPADDNSIFVLYRANHIKLDRTLTDPSLVEIDIPEYCIEPLLAYVTSKVYARNTGVEQQNASATYMAKYINYCDILENRNVLHNNPNDTNSKLERNGWV